MIPKIIHLCWLSGEEYPQDIKTCLESWHKYLPDYEIWLWDTKRFDINSTIWTKEAFEQKKYAFVADYIRLYALYHYGGIYLDSDVLVYKSFNPLLNLPYFIGEDVIGLFEAAVIGAEKETTWIKDILDYYTDRHFILPDKSLNTDTLPAIIHNQLLTKNYLFKKICNENETYSNEPQKLYVFSRDFFNSRNRVKVQQTPKSFCAHNFKGSWVTKQNNLKNRIKAKLPHSCLNFIYFFTNKLHKKELSRYSIPFE